MEINKLISTELGNGSVYKKSVERKERGEKEREKRREKREKRKREKYAKI